MAKHLLTDRHVRNAKPRASSYRLFDGDGLAMWISPTGARSWQLRYRLDGTEQTATLGKVERMTLAQARAAADTARKLVAKGEHLTTVKRWDRLQRKADAANTFSVVAAGWMAGESRRQKWTPDYLGEVQASIRNHLSVLDALPIATLNAPTVAPLLRKVEARAPMMIEKVRRRLNSILDYAVEHGMIPGNPLPAIRRRREVECKPCHNRPYGTWGDPARCSRCRPLQGHRPRALTTSIHCLAGFRSGRGDLAGI